MGPVHPNNSPATRDPRLPRHREPLVRMTGSVLPEDIEASGDDVADCAPVGQAEALSRRRDRRAQRVDFGQPDADQRRQFFVQAGSVDDRVRHRTEKALPATMGTLAP
jgi:hypothetical protein